MRLNDYVKDFEISLTLYYEDCFDLTIEFGNLSDKTMQIIENLIKVLGINKNDFKDEDDS